MSEFQSVFDAALQESLAMTDDEYADFCEEADAIEFDATELVEVEPGHYVQRGELRERDDD